LTDAITMTQNTRFSANFRSIGLLLLVVGLFLMASAFLKKDSGTSVTRVAFDSVLLSDGVVRHCITGKTIGHVSSSTLRTVEFSVTNILSSKETDDQRRVSFKSVFDKRSWGTGSAPYHKGPIASGWYIQFTMLERSGTVYAYKP
jgi:hypothetical protein